MKKYGWMCKKCGFTINSDDREEVKEKRKEHREMLEINKNKIQFCKGFKIRDDKITRRDSLEEYKQNVLTS